jgi:hypothetical protein
MGSGMQVFFVGGLRMLARLLVPIALVVGALGLQAGPARAANTIEARYMVPPTSPWAVSWVDGNGIGSCSRTVAPNSAFTLIHPTALGAFGIDHPVVVWGNGTSSEANPTCFYQEWLRLLASWGFVVVAVNSGQPGSGVLQQIAAQAIADENANPSSVFHQKLDMAHVAAAGHSQGAVGAINAVHDAADSVFASVLLMSMPDREDLNAYNAVCQPSTGCIDVDIPAAGETNALDAPIFFARGTGNHNSPPCDDFYSDKTAADWYPSMASGAPYAAATVRVNQPSPVPSCTLLDIPYPHLDLTNGYGYMNAWLVYTLNFTAATPSTARAAFVGTPPEITTNTPKWSNITRQNLPRPDGAATRSRW